MTGPVEVVGVAFFALLAVLAIQDWHPEEQKKQMDLYAMQVWLVLHGLILITLIVTDRLML